LPVPSPTALAWMRVVRDTVMPPKPALFMETVPPLPPDGPALARRNRAPLTGETVETTKGVLDLALIVIDPPLPTPTPFASKLLRKARLLASPLAPLVNVY